MVVLLGLLGAGLTGCGGAGADTAGPAAGELYVEPGAIVHAVEVVLPEAGDAARIVCDGPEQHVIEATGSRIVVPGLLADTTYACTAEVDGVVSEAFTVHTAPLPAPLRKFELVLETPAHPSVTPGYTLFNVIEEGADFQYAVAVDMQGRLRWYHRVEGAQGTVTVDYDPARNRILVGGGREDETVEPHLVRPDGGLDAVVPVDLPHHDLQVFGDGIYVLTYDGGGGICVEEHALDLGGERWRWCIPDQSELPELTNASGNSVFVRDEAGGTMVYVMLSGKSTALKIDRARGELVWRWGPDGDFGPEDLFAEWNHDLTVADCGDDVCLQFYDNGVEARQSQAVRLRLDEATGMATMERSWTEPGWYEPRWGGLHVLPEDHWLIGVGHLESVQPDSNPSALIEVDGAGEEVWRVGLLPENYALYRARRVEGCALFGISSACL